MPNRGVNAIGAEREGLSQPALLDVVRVVGGSSPSSGMTGTFVLETNGFQGGAEWLSPFQAVSVETGSGNEGPTTFLFGPSGSALRGCSYASARWSA
jgi:hypothetical protein